MNIKERINIWAWCGLIAFIITIFYTCYGFVSEGTFDQYTIVGLVVTFILASPWLIIAGSTKLKKNSVKNGLKYEAEIADIEVNSILAGQESFKIIVDDPTSSDRKLVSDGIAGDPWILQEYLKVKGQEGIPRLTVDVYLSQTNENYFIDTSRAEQYVERVTAALVNKL